MIDSSRRKITKIAREAERLVIKTMREENIGSGEFDLVHFIRKHPGASQKEVAAELNMDKGAVARRTAALERKGYLFRKDNPTDGRSRLIFPTEKAETLKYSKASVEATFYAWLLEELPEEERTAFLDTLDKVYRKSRAESRAGFPHVSAMLARGERAQDPHSAPEGGERDVERDQER